MKKKWLLTLVVLVNYEIFSQEIKHEITFLSKELTSQEIQKSKDLSVRIRINEQIAINNPDSSAQIKPFRLGSGGASLSQNDFVQMLTDYRNNSIAKLDILDFGMSIGELEGSFNVDANFWASQNVKDWYDYVKVGADIISGASAIILIKQGSEGNINGQDMKTAGIGLLTYAIIKGVGEFVAGPEGKETITQIAISRRAYDDTKSRLKEYTSLSSKVTDVKKKMEKSTNFTHIIDGVVTLDYSQISNLLDAGGEAGELNSNIKLLMQQTFEQANYYVQLVKQSNSNTNDYLPDMIKRYNDLQKTTENVLNKYNVQVNPVLVEMKERASSLSNTLSIRFPQSNSNAISSVK